MVRWCWVNFQCRGVLLIWIRVGQGPNVYSAYSVDRNFLHCEISFFFFFVLFWGGGEGGF